jgi:hypothetical protein
LYITFIAAPCFVGVRCRHARRPAVPLPVGRPASAMSDVRHVAGAPHLARDDRRTRAQHDRFAQHTQRHAWKRASPPHPCAANLARGTARAAGWRREGGDDRAMTPSQSLRCWWRQASPERLPTRSPPRTGRRLSEPHRRLRKSREAALADGPLGALRQAEASVRGRSGSVDSDRLRGRCCARAARGARAHLGLLDLRLDLPDDREDIGSCGPASPVPGYSGG